jgi:hypothetical protein
MKRPHKVIALLFCLGTFASFVFTTNARPSHAWSSSRGITQSSGDPTYTFSRIGDRTNAVSIPAGADPLVVAKAINEQRKNRSAGDVYLAYFWKSLNIDPVVLEACSGDCEANLSYLELNGRPGRELVLKLTWSFNFCRFLIYEGKFNNWKFLGHIDHDFNRYQMARHRVSNFGGRPWLVVRGQAGSGSGFSLYEETWYEVSNAGVRPVLNYPVEGHTYPWPGGLVREFKARVNPRPQKHLTLTYTVNYFAYGLDIEQQLAVNHHRATFRWDEIERLFVFDENDSSVPSSEIDAIANIETEPEEEREGEKIIGNTKFYSQNRRWVGGGYEVFLRHNFHTLLKIAKNRSHPLRDWLKQFLNDCDETEQKKQLLGALVGG